MRAAATAGLLLLLGACALSARPVDETLGSAAVGDELRELVQRALAEVERHPDDPALAIAASQCLFQLADRTLQQASTAWLRNHADAGLAEVLAADDQVEAKVRDDVVSLCTRGLDLANAAAAKTPDDVAARLHQALHLSLLAWANGPARSLMAGYGPKLVAAIDEALRLDAAHDGGAPLRLQGRFRGQAPWPYGDVPKAKESLQKACELASLPVNHLFFGDVLQKAGESDAARAQWKRAVEASADESTRWSAELLRELARARLAARP